MELWLLLGYTYDESPAPPTAVPPGCDEPPLNRPDLCHAPLTSIEHVSLGSCDHVLLYKFYTGKVYLDMVPSQLPMCNHETFVLTSDA